MSLNDLTPDEREVVRRSLVAAAAGPYFPHWEFQALLGLTRAELSDVARAWPTVDETRESIRLASNNTLANLLGYPHQHMRQLERELGVNATRLAQVFTKWRQS